MQIDYYQKYLKYKKKYLILKGGSKPLWYDALVTEATLIYTAIAPKTELDEPKNTIILTGSAAIALLLGNENMFEELKMIFTGDKKPADLDFIYKGTYKENLHNIPKCIIMLQGKQITYNRKSDYPIKSSKYMIEDKYKSPNSIPLIKEVDLTNMNDRELKQKDKPFMKLPYIIINGIKVITPEELVSLYNSFTEDINPDDVEKVKYNTNKITQLTNFIAKINESSELKKKYSAVNKDEKYEPYDEESNRPKRFALNPVSSRDLFGDDTSSVKPVPSKNLFD
jgi:hypothetical protein